MPVRGGTPRWQRQGTPQRCVFVAPATATKSCLLYLATINPSINPSIYRIITSKNDAHSLRFVLAFCCCIPVSFACAQAQEPPRLALHTLCAPFHRIPH